jgi:hypothetical protein
MRNKNMIYNLKASSGALFYEEDNAPKIDNRGKTVYVKVSKKNVKWENLTLRDRFNLFSIWSLTSLISNFSSLFGSFFYIFRGFLYIELSNFVIGFGCALAWIGCIRYLGTTYKYSFILRTFKRSLPIVLRTIISMIPFFIGYAFLGVCLFWES